MSLPAPRLPVGLEVSDPSRGLPLREASWHFVADGIHRGFAFWMVAMQGRAVLPSYVPGSFNFAEQQDWQSNQRILSSALRTSLRRRLVHATGKNAASPSTETIKIQAEWWDHAVLDVDASAAEAHGVRYTGILVFPVRETPQAAPPFPPPPETKSRGGRPPKFDWQPFATEMMRRLALDGGDVTRTELKRAMREWSAEHFDPAPDPRSVERMVDHLLPDGITPD